MQLEKRVSLPSGQKFDAIDPILEQIDQNFGRFCAIKRADDARLGLEANEQVSPYRRGVRFKASVKSLIEFVGIASDYMDSILQQGKAGREQCESDCDKIAHIEAVLSKLQEISQICPSLQDKRLQRCLDSCNNVESLLQDVGLAENLRKAKEEHKKTLKLISEEANPEATPTKEALWDIHQTLLIPSEEARQVLISKYAALEVDGVGLAVSGLTSGDLKCEAGIAIVHSSRRGANYLIFRSDKEDEVEEQYKLALGEEQFQLATEDPGTFVQLAQNQD